jgi:hypothetical protein
MTNMIFDLGMMVYDTNSNNPIMVSAGADKMSKINEPDGAGRSKASLEELYQQAIESQFPKQKDQAATNTKLLEKMTDFKDEKVDRMLREKQEYQEQAKRDAERAKKIEQK